MDYSKLYDLLMKSYAKMPLLTGGRAFRPMTLFVEVTYRCNFRCSMCQFYEMLDDPRLNEDRGKELDSSEIKKAIDQIVPMGLISFTGGETLLRSDIMELVRYSCRIRKAYIVTNGILMDEDISSGFVETGCGSFLSPGLVAVGISIEGMGKTHDDTVKAPGSFGKIVNNIRKLAQLRKEAGKRYPLIALKCVMTNQNVGELEELYRLSEDLGLDIFNPITQYNMPSPNRLEMSSSMPVAPPPPHEFFHAGLLAEQLERIAKKSKSSSVQLRLTPPGLGMDDIVAVYENRLDLSGKACYSPWSSVYLSAYGEVFPCSNYSIGNIRDEPLLQLWNNERMRRFRNELRKKGIFKSCTGCCSMVNTGGGKVRQPLARETVGG